MLKIIGFLVLAFGLFQGIDSAPRSTNTLVCLESSMPLEDCNCTIPQWKIQKILKFASQEFQFPLYDLQDAYEKGELTITEVVSTIGEVSYDIYYAPCGICSLSDDNL